MSTELLDQLVVVDRQISEHETAIWMLKVQRDNVRKLLVQAGWTLPEPKE